MSGSGPNTREAHVAFPGGKTEEGDEGGLYTGELITFLICKSLPGGWDSRHILNA